MDPIAFLAADPKSISWPLISPFGLHAVGVMRQGRMLKSDELRQLMVMCNNLLVGTIYS